MPLRPSVQKLLSILLLLAGSGLLLTARAGLRGRGKYSGVVVFDRWDTCMLVSGNYITYVSEEVKEGLRASSGKALQVDATEVFQPRNPGDALIRQYRLLGAAPVLAGQGKLDQVSLKVVSDFTHPGETAFLITVANAAGADVAIESEAVGTALFGLQLSGFSFSASDGGSFAWITRSNLLTQGGFSRTSGGETVSADLRVDPRVRMPEHFVLGPGESREIRMIAKVPAGPYEFLVAYGGGVHAGSSIVSNAICFHVEADGKALVD